MAIVGGMRQEEIWDVDTAQRYDTPGTGMFAPEVLGPTVDRLAELAGDGQALEFAIGTGRVAVPLASRGVNEGTISCCGSARSAARLSLIPSPPPTATESTASRPPHLGYDSAHADRLRCGSRHRA